MTEALISSLINFSAAPSPVGGGRPAGGRTMRARVAHQPASSNRTQLPFSRGETITLLVQQARNGWLYGRAERSPKWVCINRNWICLLFICLRHLPPPVAPTHLSEIQASASLVRVTPRRLTSLTRFLSLSIQRRMEPFINSRLKNYRDRGIFFFPGKKGNKAQRALEKWHLRSGIEDQRCHSDSGLPVFAVSLVMCWHLWISRNPHEIIGLLHVLTLSTQSSDLPNESYLADCKSCCICGLKSRRKLDFFFHSFTTQTDHARPLGSGHMLWSTKLFRRFTVGKNLTL